MNIQEVQLLEDIKNCQSFEELDNLEAVYYDAIHSSRRLGEEFDFMFEKLTHGFKEDRYK